MKWEEYQSQEWKLYQDREKTIIECPKCGALLWRKTDVVLTTYPPQFRYECGCCGWSGTGK